MELSCPSCGTKHRTENYPDAFEINCACGYSILIPDEAALAQPMAPEPDFGGSTALPISDEERDNEGAIQVHQDPAPEADHHQLLSNEMTPPDQLPSGMVYDPFELPNLDSTPSADTHDSGQANSDHSDHTDNPQNSDHDSSAPSNPAAPAAPEVQMTGQNIVSRSQLASMGQFVGPSYKVSLSGLSTDQIRYVIQKSKRLVERRPWLETKLREQGVDLASLELNSSVSGVPELLAVEIYLLCADLGGRCDFELMP